MLTSLLKSFRRRVNEPAQVPVGNASATSHRPDPGAFVEELADLVGAKIAAQEERNFDTDRWSRGGEQAARAREAQFSAGTLQDLLRNQASYAAAKELLEDGASRDLFMMLLAYRLLGHRHVRLPRNDPEHWRFRDVAKAMAHQPSECSGMFGPLFRYDVPFEGQRITLDCWWINVAWTFLIRQYYLTRGPVTVAPMPGDRVIDCGACFADTALAFAASVGDAGRVLSLEIDPGNMSIARSNVERNPMLARRIALSERALAHDPDVRLYRHGSGPGAQVKSEPSGHPLEATTIDSLVERGEIDRVDFIKMDIEGAERYALAGATRTLRRFRPRLAISVYHLIDDLWMIPTWLNDLELGYRFYLDHYTIHHEETVLYAVADSSPHGKDDQVMRADGTGP